MFNKQHSGPKNRGPINSHIPGVVRKVKGGVNSVTGICQPAVRLSAPQKNTILNKSAQTLQVHMERLNGRFQSATVSINGSTHHAVIDNEDSSRSIADLLNHPDRRVEEHSHDHPGNRRRSVICITGPDHGSVHNVLLADLISGLMNKHYGEITDVLMAKLRERERCTWMVIELIDILRRQPAVQTTSADLIAMLDGLVELMATDEPMRVAA